MVQEAVIGLMAGLAVTGMAWAGMSFLGYEFPLVDAIFCGLSAAVGSVLGGLDRPS